MNNISFDNPWLLFIGLPLLAAVIVPFAITVRRDNANFHNIASFSLHALICICITLAISGMSFETVITETNVFVLADISYSSEHNLDEVQENIDKISTKLPKNSKMGVICFGRNYQMIADLGESVPDVRTADKVDRSATDIASALRYTGNLFDDGVIKRIIVITDGVETVSSNNIIRVVNALQDNEVYVDAVFLDNSQNESVSEVQIDGVEVTGTTYVEKSEEVNVLVRVNCGETDGEKSERTNGYVSLFRDGVLTERRSASFYDGLNVVALPLYTDEAGSYNYEVRVETVDAAGDNSPYNNKCLFSQTVAEEFNVLFIGGSEDDCYAGRDIYGTKNVKYVSDVAEVPLSVEELCVYDEIVLCNFDVRTLSASTMFTSSLATLVDDYGKTLTTFGNTFVQEIKEGDNSLGNQALTKLADLLPVNIGNNDQDTRLIALVLDISLSMNFEGRFEVAKRAAKELLNAFNSKDMVMVVGFSKGITELLPPTYLTSIDAIKNRIDKCEAENGTNLGYALEYTYGLMPDRFHDKRVIIISDGMNPEDDNAKALNWAVKMSQEKISVSALGIYPKDDGDALLRSIVHNGYESADVKKVFYQSISNEDEIDVVIDDVSQNTDDIMITGDRYEVSVRRPGEEVVEGVENMGAVGGFWYNSAKSTAQTVLTLKYFRDKGVTSFDVPLYAYWSGGGNGKVVSFLSDISSNWTYEWVYGTDGEKFLANIPKATLPSERIDMPFIVKVEGSGNATTVYVETSSALQDSSSFTATLYDPEGMATTKDLSFDSSSYFATFSTDAPGRYTVLVDYNGIYKTEVDFSVSYYAEYDSFATCSKSYMYRLLTGNGKILELDGIEAIENTDSAYTSYSFKFTLPLMIVSAVAFVADIIVRQLRWKDVTSFFSGLFARRRK